MNGKQYEIKTVSVAGGSNNSYSNLTKEEKAEIARLNAARGVQHLVDQRNRPHFGGDNAEPIGQTISKMKRARKLNPGGHSFKGHNGGGFKAKE